MKLGKSIKRVRLERQISQKDLAYRAGITASFLSLLENDKKEPSLSTIRVLAEKLDVTPEFFFWDAIEIPESLDESDRKQCEIAKILVHRSMSNGSLSQTSD